MRLWKLNWCKYFHLNMNSLITFLILDLEKCTALIFRYAFSRDSEYRYSRFSCSILTEIIHKNLNNSTTKTQTSIWKTVSESWSLHDVEIFFRLRKYYEIAEIITFFSRLDLQKRTVLIFRCAIARDAKNHCCTFL
jgi:hypothetical protein